MKSDKQESRIGVFVCHCGFNISGVIDVPAVVEYAKTLPNVVCAEEDLYACSSAGLNLIKESVKNCKLNRVVVASCTPATHEPLFRKACEEAGLNKYLFEMVNIREQCSWVHTHHPKEATEKAKDLVRMAVARAGYLEPQEEPELEIEPSTLVIGGGIAGMSAAVSLARQGFRVHLVEKEANLGGMLRHLHKLQPTERDASEVLDRAIMEVRASGNIQVETSTVVKEVKGFIGNFEVTLQKSSNEPEQIKVGTIIVATGAEEFKPAGMYGYGENAAVTTQLELEQLLKKGELKKPKNVVMIQCVGARDKDRAYCSRTCCTVAVTNALLLRKMYPDAEISILFRDLQTPGEQEDFYSEARSNFINFIRYDPDKPPKVTSKPDGSLGVTVHDEYVDAEIDIDSDLVVLSTPMIQHADGRKAASTLKVPLGADGFFFEAHPKLRPVDFASEGIYVCGAAHGPKNVTESIAQACAAASRAAIPMALKKVKTEAVKATVDTEICLGCDACVVSCVFNAVGASSFGQPYIVEANCKGCGVCAAECSMGAMQLRNYKDEQIVAAIDALLKPKKLTGPVENFEPLILCFACQWCSYGAADLAGVSRIQYPPNIRILRVPCSGRVDVLHLLEAFLNGVDGVIVTGCLIGDCHYTDGNLKAKSRVETMRKSMRTLNMDSERLEIGFASSSEGQKFASMMTDFVERIRKLGPNPFRVKGAGD
jgi:heterodisulfide reductase subunit A